MTNYVLDKEIINQIFHTLVKNESIIAFAIDPQETVMLALGKGLDRLSLNDAANLTGLAIGKIFEDYPDIITQCRQALAGHEVKAFVAVEPFMLKVTYSPVFGKNGEVEYVVGFGTDISDDRQNQERQQQMLKQLETLYQISKALMATSTPDDILRIVTQHAHRDGLNATLTYIDTDAAGQPEWTEIVAQISDTDQNDSLIGLRFRATEFAMGYLMDHTDEALLIEDTSHAGDILDPARAEALFSSGVQALVIIPLSTQNKWVGSINLHWSKTRHFSPEEIYLYSVFGPQIAALVQNQRLLIQTRAAEQRFRDVALSTSDWLWEVDRSGRYTYCSERIVEVLGYTASEVIGKSFFAFAAPEEKIRIQHLQTEIMANQKPIVDFETWNIHQEGGRVCLITNGLPIRDERGRIRGYRGVDKDITERKNAAERLQQQNEALLQANEELAIARRAAEDSARLKTQFLTTMSHELRTPLNAIIGYTEIQLAGMTGEITDEQRDYQKRILANAENLLALINDILDLSKIEAGRIEIARKPYNIHQLFTEIRRQMEGLLVDKPAVAFEVNVDKRLPTLLIGDPARLQQIAINLISNAIKFTEKGLVKVDVRKHGRDTWTLVVNDTGIGIPSHAQEYIFDEFRQVDGTSRRKHSGTGLGLAIVRKLVLLMGGNIRLRSKVGEGTVFTVLLPLEIED